MEKQKEILFTPKFWPDREYRKLPDDSSLLVEEPAITDVLRYRQEMRMYYRNWVEVWRTYSYYSKFGFVVFPVIGFMSGSWIVTAMLLVLLLAFRMLITKKLDFFLQFRMFVPALLDGRLDGVFGPLPPFDDD